MSKSKQDTIFNKKSIFAGNEEWRADEGHELAMKGTEHLDPGNHTDKYIEGFEKGKITYKKKKLTAVLTGTWEGKQLSEKELDKLFDRDPDKDKSAGGILLPKI